MNKVKFRTWECRAVFTKYQNKRTAILLTDWESGEPIAKATVNVPDEPLADDEVCIKDYSENEGMLDALVKAGIVSTPLRFVQSGWVDMPVCHVFSEDLGDIK